MTENQNQGISTETEEVDNTAVNNAIQDATNSVKAKKTAKTKKKSKEPELFDQRKVQLENLSRLKERYAGKKVVLSPRTLMWGIGDLMLTCMGTQSRNFRVGRRCVIAACGVRVCYG